MSLSLKQQLNNANTELTAIEGEVNTLKTQTAEAIAFHHNFVTSDENIVQLVNRTTTNASSINTLQSTTTSQAAEIDTLETDIANNASNIVAINNSFTSTTDLLRTDLTSEISNRTNADSTLQSNIDSEAATRLASDNTLQDNIDAEKVLRENADSTLQTNIDNEASTRTTNDNTLQDNIDAEKVLRENADIQLQSNIDAESTARVTAVLSEETRALSAESTLNTKIDTLDGSLNLAIGNESTIRFTADTGLQSNIDAEALSRTDADTTLQSNIDIEKELRENADTTLQTNIDTEATNRTNADKRMTFVSVGEAEGLLTVNDYPFAFGFGSPSKAGFGLAIPFNFAIVGFALTVNSTDTSRSIGFSLEHYDVNGNLYTPQLGNVTGSLGMSNVYNTNLFTNPYPPGNICIKIKTVQNVSDINARYRFTLFCQSLDELGYDVPS